MIVPAFEINLTQGNQGTDFGAIYVCRVAATLWYIKNAWLFFNLTYTTFKKIKLQHWFYCKIPQLQASVGKSVRLRPLPFLKKMKASATECVSQLFLPSDLLWIHAHLGNEGGRVIPIWMYRILMKKTIEEWRK